MTHTIVTTDMKCHAPGNSCADGEEEQQQGSVAAGMAAGTTGMAGKKKAAPKRKKKGASAGGGSDGSHSDGNADASSASDEGRVREGGRSKSPWSPAISEEEEEEEDLDASIGYDFK